MSIPRWMIKFCVLLCLASVSRTLSPPRILYGGWTPIVPGHPFFFGHVKRKNLEPAYQQHHVHYAEHAPSSHEHFHEPHAHEVEHEIEHHVEFVSPKQYHHHNKQPHVYHHDIHSEMYQNYDKQSETYHHNDKQPENYHHNDKQQEIYHHHDKQPENYHHNDKQQEIYHHHDKPENYHHHGKQAEIYPASKEQQQISYGYKPQKDIFSYYPPQSVYDEPRKPEFQLKPVYFEIPKKPLDVFDNHHQHVPYILPSLKELPIKNFNLKSMQHGYEDTFLKVSPVGSIDSNALKHIGHINADRIQYLAPGVLQKHAGYPVIKDSSGGIQKRPAALPYLSLDILPKHIRYPIIKDSFGGTSKRPAADLSYLAAIPQSHDGYPVIKDSSGGTSKRPAALSYPRYNGPAQNYEFRSPKHLQSGITHVSYDLLHSPISHNSGNNYKGTDFQFDDFSSSKRPLSPIETKYFSNSYLQGSKLQALKSNEQSIPTLNLNKYNNKLSHLNLPVLSHISEPHIYPTSPNLYSSLKYLPSGKFSTVGLSKNLHSPALISKGVAHRMKSYLTPRYPHQGPVQPFYPLTKPLYPPVRYPYSSSKNLAHLPLRTLPTPLSPKLLANYLHKDVKLQSLYKNPSLVANIRGSPALVEREVAIIHVPVTDQHGYLDNVRGYPVEKDYLYHTASTPESTQILDIVNLNESAPYVTLNKRIPVIKNNASYTHIVLDYGRGQDLEHVTVLEPSVDSQVGPPPPESDNGVSDPPHQNQYQYIFVSSNGVRGTKVSGVELHPSDQAEAQKQFFHAYYAPPDHVPPPGYAKMTVPEFNDLFRNAEIRYVDKDPEDISRQDTEIGSQH